jgi:oxalate decarboxylase/phosphoglucose isomerase-like protein (cupin superfamily)
MNIETIQLLQFPKIPDRRGNLSVIEENIHIPMNIERVYWIYDVPGGEYRWGHAFKNTCEVIIAISGSFDVIVHDGRKEQRFQLNRSYYGLFVPKMTWRSIENFSTNSLALIAANKAYSDEEYIRDFNLFLIDTNAEKKVKGFAAI